MTFRFALDHRILAHKRSNGNIPDIPVDVLVVYRKTSTYGNQTHTHTPVKRSNSSRKSACLLEKYRDFIFKTYMRCVTRRLEISLIKSSPSYDALWSRRLRIVPVNACLVTCDDFFFF